MLCSVQIQHSHNRHAHSWYLCFCSYLVTPIVLVLALAMHNFFLSIFCPISYIIAFLLLVFNRHLNFFSILQLDFRILFLFPTCPGASSCPCFHYWFCLPSSLTSPSFSRPCSCFLFFIHILVFGGFFVLLLTTIPVLSMSSLFTTYLLGFFFQQLLLGVLVPITF